MEMRKLAGDDLWTILDIITTLDVADEIMELFDPSAREATTKKVTKLKTKQAQQAELDRIGQAVLTAFVKKALANLRKIRNPLNDLLADLTGTTPDDIKALGITEYVTLVADFFKKPELADLVSSIAKLLSSRTAPSE